MYLYLSKGIDIESRSESNHKNLIKIVKAIIKTVAYQSLYHVNIVLSLNLIQFCLVTKCFDNHNTLYCDVLFFFTFRPNPNPPISCYVTFSLFTKAGPAILSFWLVVSDCTLTPRGKSKSNPRRENQNKIKLKLVLNNFFVICRLILSKGRKINRFKS